MRMSSASVEKLGLPHCSRIGETPRRAEFLCESSAARDIASPVGLGKIKTCNSSSRGPKTWRGVLASHSVDLHSRLHSADPVTHPSTEAIPHVYSRCGGVVSPGRGGGGGGWLVDIVFAHACKPCMSDIVGRRVRRSMFAGVCLISAISKNNLLERSRPRYIHCLVLGVHAHAHTHAHGRTCTHTCRCIHMNGDPHVRMYACNHACMCARTYVCM